MVQKIGIYIGLVLLIVILFLFVRFLYIASWFNNATIDYNIVPIDVISIIVSSAITIWIGWYITKKLTEQRFEKEFLVKDLCAIETEVHHIEEIFKASGSVDISFIASKINNIQLLNSRFSSTTKLMKMDLKMGELSRTISELFTSTTNFDAPTISVHEVDQQMINQKCSNVIIEVRELIISINSQ